jgi:hypothetical protein
MLADATGEGAGEAAPGGDAVGVEEVLGAADRSLDDGTQPARSAAPAARAAPRNRRRLSDAFGITRG